MNKSTRKLRIGILTDSNIINNFYYEIVNELNSSNYCDEIFCITGYPIKGNKISFENIIKNLPNILNSILYGFIKKIIFKFESRYIKSQFPKFYKIHNLDILGINKIKVNGHLSKSGIYLTFDEKSIANLSKYNLDIILRTGSGILKGDILNIAKYGVFSYHHGDNEFLYRGGPSGFWEVLNNDDFTGFIIQKLSPQLDGGLTLYKGITLTKSLWLLNAANIKEKSKLSFMNIIKNYYYGLEIKKNTPKIYSGKINKTNNNCLVLLKYIFKIYPKIIKNLILKRIKYNYLPNRWSIAYTKGLNLNIPLYKYNEIKNKDNSFFADPFIITHKSKTILFCEEFCLSRKKGFISAFELDGDKHQYLGKVLEENHHLSFPYVFKHQDNVYMIPESGKSKQICLYQSTLFPMKWKPLKVLMDNVDAADSFLIQYEKKWFLFTNLCSASTSDHDSELHIFYCDDFCSNKWIPINSGNPVMFDSNYARNAGLFFLDNNLYRVSQKRKNKIYGHQFSINRVENLSENDYKESYFHTAYPNFKHNIIGTHHFHSDGNYSAVDFCRKWKRD